MQQLDLLDLLNDQAYMNRQANPAAYDPLQSKLGVDLLAIGWELEYVKTVGYTAVNYHYILRSRTQQDLLAVLLEVRWISWLCEILPRNLMEMMDPGYSLPYALAALATWLDYKHNPGKVPVEHQHVAYLYELGCYKLPAAGAVYVPCFLGERMPEPHDQT